MTRIAIPPFRAAALGLVLVLVAACGAQGGTPPPTVGPSPSGAPATAAPTPPASPSPAASVASPSAPATPSAGGPDLATAIAMEDVATGFTQPITASPWGDGSGRLLVAEQPGVVRLVVDGESQPDPFLDISDRVTAGGEQGLLGLAVPEGFGPDNPWLYVHYSGLEDGQTVVSAFRLDEDDPTALDADSEQVVFTTPQPYANHNGGYLGFDSTGMLLLALGDGGAGGDPQNRASDLMEPLGKLLRFDVSPVPAGEPYAIPADNPFADDPDALPEILHSGLRNPFRANVDPATGDLWIGDVGQGAWEEVDVARAGASGLDFGWRRWEGRHCYDPPVDCDPDGVAMPVTEYGRGLGCSVIGGVVYHGAAMPALDGAYVFADYCSGTLWGIDAGSDAAQEPTTLLETNAGVSSMVLDEDGEVLLTLHSDGRVVRLVPAP